MTLEERGAKMMGLSADDFRKLVVFYNSFAAIIAAAQAEHRLDSDRDSESRAASNQ